MFGSIIIRNLVDMNNITFIVFCVVKCNHKCILLFVHFFIFIVYLLDLAKIINNMITAKCLRIFFLFSR